MSRAPVPQTTSPGEQPPKSFLRRYGWLLAGIGLTYASLLLLTTTHYGATGLGGLSVIVVFLIVLMRLLPPKLPLSNPLADKTHAQLRAETRPILIYALLYPLLLFPVVIWGKIQNLPLLPGWTTSWILSLNYIVFGKILLLLVPTVFLTWRDGGNARQLGLSGITNPWRWIGPIIPTVLYMALAAMGLLEAILTAGKGHYHLTFGIVLVVLAITFFGAGFPEEFFYRVLLQTRLELLLGRWNSLTVAVFLFTLLHLPSRFLFIWLGKSGSPAFDFVLALAGIISSQGVLGFFLGYMWMRYRNAWMNMFLHTTLDALTFTAIAAGVPLTIR